MNEAMPNNTTNEISILRGIKRMTICELEELSSQIHKFLDSQDVEMTKNRELGKVDFRLQEILIPFGIKKISRNELKELGLRVRGILFSHNMKFIKNRGQRNSHSHNDRGNLANGFEFSGYTQCYSNLFTVNEFALSTDGATR